MNIQNIYLCCEKRYMNTLLWHLALTVQIVQHHNSLKIYKKLKCMCFWFQPKKKLNKVGWHFQKRYKVFYIFLSFFSVFCPDFLTKCYGSD